MTHQKWDSGPKTPILSSETQDPGLGNPYFISLVRAVTFLQHADLYTKIGPLCRQKATVIFREEGFIGLSLVSNLSTLRVVTVKTCFL